jgi:hypothetical protein
MWIPFHVRISGNEVADGLARQAVESGIIHGPITTAYWLDKQWLSGGNMFGGQETRDTGQFAHSIHHVVAIKPWFEGLRRGAL